MLRALRALPMPAADWLRECGLDERTAVAACLPALLGTWLGPHSAGSAACTLFRAAVRGRPVRGGAPALVAALAAACAAEGVEVRTAAPVRGLEVGRSRVSGVVLASGDTVPARRVVSTESPQRTLLEWLEPGLLEVALGRRLRAFRCRGTAATLDLALAAPVEVGGAVPARIAIGPATLDGLERAFDRVKYGQASESPVVDLVQQVREDGAAVVSGLVGWVPWGEGGEADFGEEVQQAVLGALEPWAPGIRDRVVASRLRTPRDLARDHHLAGGHLHGGEHALDQLLFMRPTPELARYRTPVRGLYLGGAGSHPGGGHTGMPGMLAAEALLADDG